MCLNQRCVPLPVPLEAVTSSETFAAQAGEVLLEQQGASVTQGSLRLRSSAVLAAIIMSAPRV